jgi:hypothetical protein
MLIPTDTPVSPHPLLNNYDPFAEVASICEGSAPSNGRRIQDAVCDACLKRRPNIPPGT